MQIISLAGDAKDAVSRLDPEYARYSEMAPSEQLFLTALVQKYKPKKAVEIGVAAGSSAVLLLNALSDLPNKELISVEYMPHYYRDNTKKPGFVVDSYPELKKNWTLYTDGLVAEHINEIGGEIDFCFIDTMHLVPGEILDFIAILPCLAKDAVVVLHDTNLHTWEQFPYANVNNLLLSALTGEKLVPERHEDTFYHNILKHDIHMPFANIGAVALDGNQKERVWDVFNLLTQPWGYLLPDRDLESMRTLLKEHYNRYFLDYFDAVNEYQKQAVARKYVTNKLSKNKKITDDECRKKLRRRYCRYKILSKICFGERREKYGLKRKQLKMMLKAR